MITNLQEKQNKRFERWMNPEGLQFATDAVKQTYKRKITQIKDLVQLAPDPRVVPLYLITGLLPAHTYGLSAKDALADQDLTARHWEKFFVEYDTTMITDPTFIYHAPPLAALDFKFYRWPGHNAPDAFGVQYQEAEYIKADEYDEVLLNPDAFWIRKILPRIAGRLEPLSGLGQASSIIELLDVYGYIAAFGRPDVQNALKALMEAGALANKWLAGMGRLSCELAAKHGLVSPFGGGSKAPFDILADTLRGIQNTLMDIIKRPDEVECVVEKFTQLAISRIKEAAPTAPTPLFFLPLHMGADGFISQAHWERFYWPGLKKVLLAIIEEGLVPYCFAEGGYNTRLEYLKQLPRASCIWHFDRTDMHKAKKILGGHLAIAGNISSNSLDYKTPQEVEKECELLIKKVGAGGGFMLANGVVADTGQPEVLKTIVNSVKKFKPAV